MIFLGNGILVDESGVPITIPFTGTVSAKIRKT
jgi:hypothetical protein